MSDKITSIIQKMEIEKVKIENLKNEQIAALKQLYSSVRSWIENSESKNVIEITEEETLDIRTGYTELAIKFTEVHGVTIRPYVSHPEDKFFVHVNYYKEFLGMSDLASSPANTTKLIYSSGEWEIEPSVSFGQQNDKFTEATFLDDIERKMFRN
ncbi:hypothetical protein M3629_17555 [Paenibacillus polysaccharolyticus]|uniref:hypothetical protein n=1 Tax=Paenibacillus polysaccharolyticus TaxID=582692 RepID=UPI00203DB0D6|nr:hypothetical protein [Paenibacillus polysaccharolyticus]MCM3134599.1 hypothetical protein [Paenibacillus polysaccharolyticus]